jgi:hypothetical protein
MAYSNFTLDDVEDKLGITVKVESGVFSSVEPKEITELLAEILHENIPLALSISTEKARSEMIVAPILVELRKEQNKKISLFSGVEFNVDYDKGLNGVCDFLISQSEQQLKIDAPIIALVEAKNDNLKSGLAQCIAEMEAAKIFNYHERNPIKRIFGVVTTGSIWNFLYLEDKTVVVDAFDYALENPNRIFGILSSMLHYNRNHQ